MSTADIERKWKNYLQAYGPVTSAERDALLKGSVTEDVIFTNPGGEGKTRAGLIAHIEQFQADRPGAHFSNDKILAHEDEFLAIWSMHKKDGIKVATGYNYVRVDSEMRFSYMAGFFQLG